MPLTAPIAQAGVGATPHHRGTGEEVLPEGGCSSNLDGRISLVKNRNQTVSSLKKETAGLGNGMSPPKQGGTATTIVTSSSSLWFQKRKGDRVPLVYKLELNVIWWMVVLLATAVRVWRLDYPGCVV